MDAMMGVFWGAVLIWSGANAVMVFNDKGSITYRAAEMVSTLAVGAEVGTLLCHFLTA